MKRLSWITTFLPWIIFDLLSAQSPALSLPFAIAICCLFSYSKLRRGFILEWGSLLFFTAAYIDFQFFHHQWLTQHRSLVSSLFFVGVAGFSLLIRQPFTLQYAKLQVEKQKWDSPHFMRINQWMTGGFGLIFLAGMLGSLYCLHHPGLFSKWLIEGITLLVQGVFITQFPKWYKKRVLR